MSKLSKSERKLVKKQAKACHTLFKLDGVRTVSNPTSNLLVANGGLGNGVQRDEIQQVFSCVGPVKSTVMLRGKPYCFVTYAEVSLAATAMHRLHGYRLKSGQGPASVTLYLSFVENVPIDSECHPSLPSPGLILIPDFLDEETEQTLIESIDWETNPEAENRSLKHRRVKHYGYEFNYATNNVDKDKPLSAGMPALYSRVIDRILATGHIRFRPDQLTVNQYQPGQGIPPHVDTHSAFEDAIISLSLGSQVVMEFTHPDGRHVPVLLPNRSLLILTGEARYLWTHGITPRKSDVIPDPTSPESLTLRHRGQRTSFTFRAVRHDPCKCKYPAQCDSQKEKTDASMPPQVAFPQTEEEAAKLESEQVHAVYNNIADHFSGTRYKPWPKVVDFLNQLKPGSLVLDVGCGNGKYLGINKSIYMMGCDRSDHLIDICRDRGLEGFVCDSLSLPVGEGSMDACISIAVIHHMSTRARRLQALSELTRILRPRGKALVTVWAMEQEHKQQKSKYIANKKAEMARAEDSVSQDSSASDNLCGSTRECAEKTSEPPYEVGSRICGHGDEECNKDGHGNRTTGHKTITTPADEESCEAATSIYSPQESVSSDRQDSTHTLAGGLCQSKTSCRTDMSGHQIPIPMIHDKRNANMSVNENNESTIHSESRETLEQNGGRSGIANCDNSADCHLTRTEMDMDKMRTGVESPSKDTIAVHKNRTQFEQQDLLVPWHLKKSKASAETVDDSSSGDAKEKVFFRYYHVFIEGEMEELCQTIPGVRVISSYYDQGNWCVIFQRL